MHISKLVLVCLLGGGGIQDFSKGDSYIKRCEGRFADFISFSLNAPWRLTPDYIIFIGYLKTGRGREIQANPL